MNLFRSEEHVRNWSGFDPQAEAGLRTLRQMMQAFSVPLFRERLSGRYISDLRAHYGTLQEAFRELGGGDPFWLREG